MKNMAYAVLPIAAVGLDLVLGDPRGWPHPVRAVGWALDRLDTLADRLGWRTKVFGIASVLAVATGSGAVVWLAGRLPWIGPLASLYFAYAGLALGSLLGEARKAARFLEEGSVEAARNVVAGLVSRDVTALDADGLGRALAESVAENANDAFVAPLLYLALAGPVGLWVYKAVSTADSMWGYRTARHGRLGWFGARADDVLAYVPARLTAGAMWLVGGLLGKRTWGLWDKMTRDAKKSASPNAGWPMAAAAWVCGGRMGGPAVYFGHTVDKPRLGPEQGEWNAQRQRLLQIIVFMSGMLVTVLMIFIKTMVHYSFER
jgi:adenosylcobinamide-phosphate synthase